MTERKLQKRSGSHAKMGERGHSSVGRASALQAEGHRFESVCLHHFFLFFGDFEQNLLLAGQSPVSLNFVQTHLKNIKK